METKNPMFECMICLNDYKLKNIVKCGFCDYVGCIKCSRTCIIRQANDPCCPNCNHAWSHEFNIENLGKSFMNNDFKKKKKELLFDIEVSKIPETMNEVERAIDMDIIRENIDKMEEEAERLEFKLSTLKNNIYRKNRQLQSLKYNKNTKKRKFKLKCPHPGCAGYVDETYKCAMCKNKTCSKCYEIMEKVYIETKNNEEKFEYNHTCNPDSVQSFEMIKKETRACPSCSARIFKISGCDQMWCTECHVAFSWKTGMKVSGKIHNPHYYEWKKDNIDTEGIRNVGEILCGGLRSTNNLNKMLSYANNAEKLQLVCGGPMPTNFTFHYTNYQVFALDIFTEKKSKKIKKYVEYRKNDKNNLSNSIILTKMFIETMLKLNRLITHFQDQELGKLREDLQYIDYNDVSNRVKFIRKIIDENKFKTSIIKKYTKKQKLIKIIHVYEMCYVTLLETYNEIDRLFLELYNEWKNTSDTYYTINKSNIELSQSYYKNDYIPRVENWKNTYSKKILHYSSRISNIIAYCNKELWKISKTYNQVVPFISNTSGAHLISPLYSKNLKYDDKIFQLYETVTCKNGKIKKVKVKDERQEEHFKNASYFQTSHISFYNSYTDKRDNRWKTMYFTMEDIFDVPNQEEKNNSNTQNGIHSQDFM